ncbi:hypothetical protein [Nocardia terpenica]|uniref:Uncharacterized protein n=1 Tax=Nocardia terpenica TaxID=455432 RepID=A0A164JJB0_9NOCA|nr:hypothetical protein [Nocardia terpenica]KZM70456.1 hypothetical protein AWN90_04045 [Nocardia terpenica]NQE91143.1 hypothetical protein [Nocardia terpenica]
MNCERSIRTHIWTPPPNNALDFPGTAAAILDGHRACRAGTDGTAASCSTKLAVLLICADKGWDIGTWTPEIQALRADLRRRRAPLQLPTPPEQTL